MSDFAEMLAWLIAELDHDERVAKAAQGDDLYRRPEYGRWAVVDGEIRDEDGQIVVYDEGAPVLAEAEHIALHDPCSVLADVAAVRAVLALGEQFAGHAAPPPGEAVWSATVRALCVRYADRTGYRAEWLPPDFGPGKG